MAPPVRFAGSGACLAALARSLARFLRGRGEKYLSIDWNAIPNLYRQATCGCWSVVLNR
jgi:hypothetical protein